MARKCEICGKQSSYGNKVSHSNRKTRRRWQANLQKVRADVNGAPKNILVCTKCLKANKVLRYVKSIPQSSAS